MVTTLARRVQEHCKPGHVLISQSTQDLIRPTIHTEPLPNIALKGFAETQTLYQAKRIQPAHRIAEQPFFVGRRAQLDQITQSEKPALVVGPAGIGKSALVRHMAKSASAGIALMGEGTHMRAIYRPFARWIWYQTGTELPQMADIKRAFGMLDQNHHHALALALGLPEGQQLLVQKSNVALKAMIERSLWKAIQAIQPSGLLVFEDLHWLDDASMGVLVHILQSPSAARYQILMTSREEAKTERYFDGLDIITVRIDALNDDEAREMFDRMSGGQTDEDTKAQLIAKAGGVPFFLEQLTKGHVAAKVKDSAVPSSLADLLAAQIDATGAAKPMLQCAAVIGRTFQRGILAAITPDPNALETHLQVAAAQGVIRPDDAGNWMFTHALLHQATYESLLRSTRVTYHGQVAAYLQEHHPDFVQRNPTLVTEHLGRAQQHEPAIKNFLAASKLAMLQGALASAEAHILAALTLCNEAPDNMDLRALEIACYTALGSVRMQTLGFTAEPVRTAFARVAELAAGQNAYSAVNGPAFYGSYNHAIISANKAGADQFSDMLRDAAEAAEIDSTLRLASLNVDTSLSFYKGNFAQAFIEFAVLRELYYIAKHGTMISHYGIDTFAAGQMFETVGRAICGDSHLVLKLHAETDAHQRLLNIPVMQPFALILGALPLFYIGQVKKAVARVHKGRDAAISQGASFWQLTGDAWLHVMDRSKSDTAQGLADFEQVINAHDAIGAHVELPYFRAHFALALARHGQIDHAYTVSQRAVLDNKANGLLCWYAEVVRIHAQICRMAQRPDDMAMHLAEAAAVAIRQNAKLWLLRTRLDQISAGLIDAATLRATLSRFHSFAKLPEITRAREVLAPA